MRVHRIVLVAALLGIVLSAGSAGATTQTKFYGASVSPTGPVAASSSLTYTLTLTNESNSTQTIGSGDFWAPPGWTVNSPVPTPVTSTDSHTWNISKQSGVTAPDGTKADAVQFRAATNNDALTPGNSVTAHVVATAACTAGGALWQTETKQANNFSGNPGNDFLPAAGQIDTTVTVSPAALASFVFNTIGTQTTGVKFTVTVTAKDTCGNTKTDYTGTTSVLSGNLKGISPYPALSWSTGVGTADLTPTASQLGAMLHVQDGAIGADSNKFNVVDQGATCTATSGPCHLSNGTTTVDVGTPTGNETLNLGLVSGSGLSFTDCSGGALPGEAVVTVDPTGYTSSFIITLTYDKSIAPGTGVSNFVVCKSNDNGATWEQLSPCKNHPSPPCISSRNRTGAGDLVENLLVTPTDPVYGTD